MISDVITNIKEPSIRPQEHEISPTPPEGIRNQAETISPKIKEIKNDEEKLGDMTILTKPSQIKFKQLWYSKNSMLRYHKEIYRGTVNPTPTDFNCTKLNKNQKAEFSKLIERKVLLECNPNIPAYYKASFIEKKNKDTYRMIANGKEAALRRIKSDKLVPAYDQVKALITLAKTNSKFKAATDFSAGFYNIIWKISKYNTVRIMGRVYLITGPVQGISSSPAIADEIFRNSFNYAGFNIQYVDNGVMYGNDYNELKTKFYRGIEELKQLGYHINEEETEIGREITFLSNKCIDNKVTATKRYKEKAERCKDPIKTSGHNSYKLNLYGNPNLYTRTFEKEKVYVDGAKHGYAFAGVYSDERILKDGIQKCCKNQDQMQSERIAIQQGIYLCKKYNLQRIYTDADSVVKSSKKTINGIIKNICQFENIELFHVRSLENLADEYTRQKHPFYYRTK